MPYIITPTQIKKVATHTDAKGNYYRIVDTTKVKVEGSATTVTDISGYTEIPPTLDPIPREIPLWSFRSILIQDGLLQDVLDIVSQEPDANKRAVLTSFLEYGNTILRNSPTLKSIALILNKTEQDIDDVFRRASKLKL